MLTRKQVKRIIADLTPQEKRELDLAKRLLAALIKAPVYNFGMFCNVKPFKSLQFTGDDMYIAVNCLNRLGYKVERTDAGGNPTWQLLDMPPS